MSSGKSSGAHNRRNRLFRWLVWGTGILLLSWLLLRCWPLDDAFFEPKPPSLHILDRHGQLLRDVLLDDAHSRPISLEHLPKAVTAAFVCSEDRRFFYHVGVDPIAMIRAAWQNVRAKGVVSGASTITEQTCRMIQGLPRTLSGRLRASWCALCLERQATKGQILQTYLQTAPFGNRIRGLNMASRGYFRKDPQHLNPSEAACLAVILRAPTVLNPLKDPQRVWKKARQVIEKLHDVIGDEGLAMASIPHFERPEFPFLAPHATTFLLQENTLQASGAIRTTLDPSIQKLAEDSLKKHLGDLGRDDIENGAVVVADSISGHMLALVGSSDFFDEQRQGQVNGAMALRMPGSTLKPFLYAMALEQGYGPATLLDDIRTSFPEPKGGSWEPRNHDGTYHGPVRFRNALASSLNVPAVRLLQDIGVPAFLDRLHQLGFVDMDRGPGEYGLGLVLGDAPVRLTSLVAAYATLARGGRYVPLSLVDVPTPSRGTPVFLESTSDLISDILSDPNARMMTFGRSPVLRLPVAVKTGTSSDHRDSWCLGYTPQYTVGVWVGNMGGASMGDLWGLQGAAPIFSRIMKGLHGDLPFAAFSSPRGYERIEICPLSGKKRGDFCPGSLLEWHREGQPLPLCDMHLPHILSLSVDEMPAFHDFRRSFVTTQDTQAPPAESPRILYPPNQATFLIDPNIPRRLQTISFKTNIDGQLWIQDSPGPFCKAYQPCRWPMVLGTHSVLIAGHPRSSIRIIVTSATMQP